MSGGLSRVQAYRAVAVLIWRVVCFGWKRSIFRAIVDFKLARRERLKKLEVLKDRSLRLSIQRGQL